MTLHLSRHCPRFDPGDPEVANIEAVASLTCTSCAPPLNVRVAPCLDTMEHSEVHMHGLHNHTLANRLWLCPGKPCALLSTEKTMVEALPAAHRKVLDECTAEAWRNYEQADALTERDVAADIADRLYRVFEVTAAFEQEWVVITGDPFKGITLRRLFDDEGEAEKWAEDNHRDEPWWLAQIGGGL